MKLTVLLATGLSEVIQIEPPQPNMTDEDVLAQTCNTWNHALVCDHEAHLLRFRLVPSGDYIVLAPQAIIGFTTRVETRQ